MAGSSGLRPLLAALTLVLALLVMATSAAGEQPPSKLQN
jgi:hypothetical protein